MHLVENDERIFTLGQEAVLHRLHRDLRIGHHHTVKTPAIGRAIAVRVARVQVNAATRRGIGPLGLQVLGRRDHDNLSDRMVGAQDRGKPQRKRRFARARRRGHEKVARLLLEVTPDRFFLPSAQGTCRTACGAIGVRGREVFGCTRARQVQGWVRLDHDALD